jgi:hypothetical protein
MDQERIEKNISKTVESLKQYVNLKAELYSLIVIERSAKILARVIILLILTMLLFFFLLFISFAFVHWFGATTGSNIFGYLIVAAFYLILGLLIYLMKKQLFLDPLLRGITSIFNEEEDLLDKSINPADDEENEGQ